MYDLKEELKTLMRRLDNQGDRQESQTMQQAIVRIENLTYDVEMYKKVLK